MDLQMKKILVDDHIWDFNLEAALNDISAQRKEQALKFKYEQGQRLCVLAYRLLKQGLRELYGIVENPVFTYNEHGKPSIDGYPDIYFNLSHCGEAAVCAISSQPIGIDVESIREYRESLVHYTMNEAEIDSIESSPNPAAAFIKLWTMKEATLKLYGTGINNNIKQVIDSSMISYTTIERTRYIYTVAEFHSHVGGF